MFDAVNVPGDIAVVGSLLYTAPSLWPYLRNALPEPAATSAVPPIKPPRPG